MPKIAATQRDAFYESRRAELTEVALKLWAQKGFAATSVAAVAKAAGISKGTMYLYFPSKQALLEEVLRRHGLLSKIESLAENIAGKSFEEAVHTFVRHVWRHLNDRRDLVLLVLRELPNYLEQPPEGIEQVLVNANKMLALYLENHVGEQRARELSLIVAGRGLLGMIVMLFLTQEILGVRRLLPIEEEEIVSSIAQVFLRGVLGPQGSAS